MGKKLLIVEKDGRNLRSHKGGILLPGRTDMQWIMRVQNRKTKSQLTTYINRISHTSNYIVKWSVWIQEDDGAVWSIAMVCLSHTTFTPQEDRPHQIINNKKENIRWRGFKFYTGADVRRWLNRGERWSRSSVFEVAGAGRGRSSQ